MAANKPSSLNARLDHFQMLNLPATPDVALRDDYGTGNQACLTNIWSKLDTGCYAG
ncbi:MAG TPA: hypothetical protein VIJ79_14615 [Acidobacteriaceae bacterium]